MIAVMKPSRSSTPISIELAFLMLKNQEEARAFLSAVLSERALLQLQNRWAAYQHRRRGMTIVEIVRETGIATATASRAAKLSSASPGILDSVVARARRRRKPRTGSSVGRSLTTRAPLPVEEPMTINKMGV
jgi:uncharacterized protein YerC